MLTRVELREEVDEVPHLLLLGARGPLGVVGRHGVQEGPGAAAQLLAVQGAVGGRLLLLHRGLREGRRRTVGAHGGKHHGGGTATEASTTRTRGRKWEPPGTPREGEAEGYGPTALRGRREARSSPQPPAHTPPYHGARRCLLLLLAEPALEIRTSPARLLGLLLRSGAGSPRRNGERESERAAFGARERRSAAAGAALTGRRHLGAAVHRGPWAAAQP